jgi:hypothetical protein
MSTESKFNVNTLLAVFTLVAGIMVVSQKLSSDRPSGSPSDTFAHVGDQKSASRLWEDPLAAWEKVKDRQLQRAEQGLESLVASLASTNRPLLLPVMVPGGGYSEDREGRIRSRVAVVSALAAGGYAPSDAEHVGVAGIGWPVTSQVHGRLTGEVDLSNFITNALATTNDGHYVNFKFAYEMYYKRTFDLGGKAPESRVTNSQVMVVWLNDEMFEDEPLIRMAAFLEGLKIRDTQKVAWIGPRRSSTLRGMLPGEISSKSSALESNRLSRIGGLKARLRQIELYSATASAIDEALIKAGNQKDFETPRLAVQNALTNWFTNFYNFNATDAQLAQQAFEELKLRQVDLKQTNQHLVLISEWDTFFGRVLSMTYAAEIARLQAADQKQVLTRGDYILQFETNESAWPKNLHQFHYARGLDGQTSDKNNADPENEEKKKDQRRAKPDNFNELRKWTPDANRAEGSPQFDYLTRLGGQIEALSEDLRRQGKGSVTSIAIAGSDLYDTLLILQALRDRFPNVVFFTTDLDARYWHPRERSWAQNLVVLSSYGLQLNEKLQRGVPPFRDSQQTAQFAAVLAAVGKVRPEIFSFSQPRTFEISRNGAFDLSPETADAGVHPPRWAGPTVSFLNWKRTLILGLAVLSAMALMSLMIPQVRRLMWDKSQQQAESLWLKEEDLGDSAELLERIEHDGDAISRWMVQELQNLHPIFWTSSQMNVSQRMDKRGTFETSTNDVAFKSASQTAVTALAATTLSSVALPSKLSHEEEEKAQMKAKLDPWEANNKRRDQLLEFLNSRIRKHEWAPFEGVLNCSSHLSEESRNQYRVGLMEDRAKGPFLLKRPIPRLQENRRTLDEYLATLTKVTTKQQWRGMANDNLTPLEAASNSRRAGFEIYKIRILLGRWFFGSVFGGATLIGALLYLALRDSTSNTGEPFSFFSGASAWPTELFRAIALSVTVGLLASAHFGLRVSTLRITRRYRLKLAGCTPISFNEIPALPVPQTRVSANSLWETYQLTGSLWNRCKRSFLPILLYLSFGLCLMAISGLPYRPVRGTTLNFVDLVLLTSSVMAFLALTFYTIDAAKLCSWFISHLSRSPTEYPASTRAAFKKVRGEIHENHLDEWIDLQLIADLTEQVGRLLYFPFIIFAILLVSRNSIWDRWPWPLGLVIIFSLNLVFAVTSVLILQHAAKKAREVAIETLLDKINTFKGVTSSNPTQNSLSRAEELLEELRNIRRGAFSPFWENPVVGAVLLPSGSAAIIELVTYFLSH